MKKKLLLYFFIVFFFSTFSLNGQITISPEIGLSCLPFTFYPQTLGSFNIIHSKEVNLLLGVSAQMPVHEKWNTKLRISYTNRNNVEWVESGSSSLSDIFDSGWKHQDLNIDLNLGYNLYKNISIGVGPSLIRSFGEFTRANREDSEIFSSKANKFFFGLNAVVSLEIEKLTISLMYLRTRRYNGRTPVRLPNGDNRLDFTVGYRIGKRK